MRKQTKILVQRDRENTKRYEILINTDYPFLLSWNRSLSDAIETAYQYGSENLKGNFLLTVDYKGLILSDDKS